MADETLTYYGYEQPNTPDWDYNSWMGIGDRQNDLTNGYSAALSISARKQLLGVDSQNSTGQEFTYQGKTYRDDDTSPQSFANIDVYSPGGVPGSSSYNAAIVTPLGKSSGQSLVSTSEDLSSTNAHQQALSTSQEPLASQQTPSQNQGESLLSGFKKAFPQHANIDLSEFMKRVQAMHPNIEPARLEELYTKSGTWQQLAEEDKIAKADWDKSFSNVKQFYEGGSDGGSGSGTNQSG